MAALAILSGIAGVGVFCWLLWSAAIYALPFFVGLSVAFFAQAAGAGAFGAVVLGFGAAVLVVAVGQTILALTRSPTLRIAVALTFAAPAALAGYFTTFSLFGLTSTSDGWSLTIAIVGAIAIGATSWLRLSWPAARRNGKSTSAGTSPGQ